ncbi:MAG: hypothetical protein AB7P40_17865 [Chloroflexota bacterium]
MIDERASEGGQPDRAPAATEALDGGAVQSDAIGVGSGDENVAKLQLAARWAERFAPETGDTLESALNRFKRAYHYVDSVTKLVEPDAAL